MAFTNANPAAGDDGAAQAIGSRQNYVCENSQITHRLQVQSLIARFGLSRPAAKVVALLAYGDAA
jgi:hypothetical protein